MHHPPRPGKFTSRNSIECDANSLRELVISRIAEAKIVLPPTKQSLVTLFKNLNLRVPMQRVYECLIFCRGAKMEQSNPDDFQLDTLIDWFLINIRTLDHLDEKKVDKTWIAEKRRIQAAAASSLPPEPWKPQPKAFIRKGTGSGGGYVNRLLY